MQNYFLQTASFYFHDIFIGRLYIVISEITSYNKSVIRERRYEMNEKIIALPVAQRMKPARISV